ncbi:MAG: hypothetical protein P8181_17295, partial [bacterium]
FYRLAGVYERIGHLDSALVAIDGLIQRDPNHREAVLSAVGISLRFQMVDRAKGYLRNWLATHPNDTGMRNALEELNTDEETSEPADTAGPE